MHITTSINLAVLCNNEMAFQAIAQLLYTGALKVVILPEKNQQLVADFKSFFAASTLTILTVNRKKLVDTLKSVIARNKVDAVLLMSFPYILPASLLKVPRLGFINFHYGLLPQYRGVNPVLAQMLNYERYGGITVHVVDEGVDTGPVIMQQKIEIKDDDTFGMHLGKLSVLGSTMAVNLLRMLTLGVALPTIAQDSTKAGYYGRVTAQNLMINWNKMSANQIIRLINACNPWNKGAGAVLNQQVICFVEAELLEDHSYNTLLPGTIVTLDNINGLRIQCSDARLMKINIIYTPDGFLSAHKLSYGAAVNSRFN